MAKVQEHRERIIETVTNMPYDEDAAMDWNQRYRFVIRDWIISEMKTTETEAMEYGINKPVSIKDIMFFATDSPNEFDELINLIRQAVEETKVVTM